jgi:hypothetical protein
MSILPTRVVRFYRCDQCKREFTWGPKSGRFGSVLLEECSPGDCPVVCSEQCRLDFQTRILAGEVKVPHVNTRKPYSPTLQGERKGY